MPPLPFTPFQKDVPVHVSKSNLPHWSQKGATHFVTFRQADSIPWEAMDRWKAKREEWLSKRSLTSRLEGWLGRLSTEDRKEYRRLFGATFESMIDQGHGTRLLEKPDNRKVMETALRFFDGERYQLGDFVIMPNHVHVLLVPVDGFPIQKSIASWKGFTAREINKLEGNSGQFWQSESFDHIVRNRRQLDHLRDYIADNPKKANLRPDQFSHFAAEWQD